MSSSLIPCLIYNYNLKTNFYTHNNIVSSFCLLPLKRDIESPLDRQTSNNYTTCENEKCLCLKGGDTDALKSYFKNNAKCSEDIQCYYNDVLWYYTLRNVCEEINNGLSFDQIRHYNFNEFKDLLLNEVTQQDNIVAENAYSITFSNSLKASFAENNECSNFLKEHVFKYLNLTINDYRNLDNKNKQFIQIAFCISFDLLLSDAKNIEINKERFCSIYNNNNDEQDAWDVFWYSSKEVVKKLLENKCNTQRRGTTLSGVLNDFCKRNYNHSQNLIDIAKLPILASVMLAFHDLCDYRDKVLNYQEKNSREYKFVDTFFKVILYNKNLREQLDSSAMRLSQFFTDDNLNKIKKKSC